MEYNNRYDSYMKDISCTTCANKNTCVRESSECYEGCYQSKETTDDIYRGPGYNSNL